jgi:hypothetical protein
MTDNHFKPNCIIMNEETGRFFWLREVKHWWDENKIELQVTPLTKQFKIARNGSNLETTIYVDLKYVSTLFYRVTKRDVKFEDIL